MTTFKLLVRGAEPTVLLDTHNTTEEAAREHFDQAVRGFREGVDTMVALLRNGVAIKCYTPPKGQQSRGRQTFKRQRDLISFF